MKQFSEVFNFNNPNIMKVFYLVGSIVFGLSCLGIIANFFLITLNLFGYIVNIFNFLFNFLLTAIFFGSYRGLVKTSKLTIINKEFDRITNKIDKKK